MKIRTRIATAVTVALATVFVATPAFAHNGEDHGPSMFDHSGDPFSYVAIAVLMVILLAVVLLGSTWVGNMFERNYRDRQKRSK